MKRWSSRRVIGAPMMSVAIPRLLRLRRGCGLGRRSRFATHRRARLADRGDDVVVAGAAADVALERMADLVVAGVALAGQEVGRRHDHAGGAETALETVL